MRSEVAPWWRQAEADLDTARVTPAASKFYAASWFAQQAVEKALKALYMERNGVLAPRTHDLNFLARQLGVPSAEARDVALINPMFDQVRYPDPVSLAAPVDSISPALATQHVTSAERILA